MGGKGKEPKLFLKIQFSLIRLIFYQKMPNKNSKSFNVIYFLFGTVCWLCSVGALVFANSASPVCSCRSRPLDVYHRQQ